MCNTLHSKSTSTYVFWGNTLHYKSTSTNVFWRCFYQDSNILLIDGYTGFVNVQHKKVVLQYLYVFWMYVYRPSVACRQKHFNLKDLDICSPTFNHKRAVMEMMLEQERQLCDVLLDQDILPGVGNIIKNEVVIHQVCTLLQTDRATCWLSDCFYYSILLCFWANSLCFSLVWLQWMSAALHGAFWIPVKWCTYSIMGCYMAGASRNYWHLAACSVYARQPCTSLQCYLNPHMLCKMCWSFVWFHCV